MSDDFPTYWTAHRPDGGILAATEGGKPFLERAHPELIIVDYARVHELAKKYHGYVMQKDDRWTPSFQLHSYQKDHHE